MDNTHFIPWLAGLLEGEGYFSKGYKSKPKQAAVSIEMTDEDIIRRVANYWGVKYAACKVRDPKWKQTYKTQIRGAKAIQTMIDVYDYMSERRKARIDEVIEHCGYIKEAA